MYEWSKGYCPACGQTTPSTTAPCQTINYTTYEQRQDILKSKLPRDCICSKKFTKCQKWRKRERLIQRFFIYLPYANNFVSTSSKAVQHSSWILMLTFTLLLVCCQGNNVQPAPIMVKSELHDVMVPVGKSFYYKIPVSVFQCEVGHLMVTEASNRFLSHWLAYSSLERELYGVPSDGDVGTYTILVVALARGELKRGEICSSKTFVITVPPEDDTRIPVPIMSAALQSAVMGEDGSVQFDNPNMGYRVLCFPGMHTTFASVLINVDFNQLNGHERINIIRRVALHLGISPAKINAFSDQVPHPLISGLESPSLIATGAGDGRFVKGIRTVFTWTLGCGALKVNETAISHLTASSQDGTFGESVGHSIFGWHIMSGVQKSLPKIRVRRAALVGTPTPTTTVAMLTAVSVTSTTVIYNGSVSLSRVVPSVNSTISLTPHIVSSTLVAPTLSPNLTASSMEFIATLNLSASASKVQTLDATVFSPSTMLNSTTDAVTVIGTSSTVQSFSPSLLLPTQNVTVVLSPSPTAIFQTATFSPTPRINSSVAEVKTTSLVVELSLTVGPTVSDSAAHHTTLETQNSSSATEEQDFSPTLSRTLNQTATVVDSLSQTIEPSTILSTAINQTSLMMTTVSTSSSVISAVSASAVNNTTASVSILPSSNVTSTTEMISSLITQPNRTESLTPSTNQTGSSPAVNVASSVTASKTSSVVMTTVLSTTNSTQVIPTPSSVVLQLNKTSDLALSISLASFTPALNLTSSINMTRSRPVMTTTLNTSSSQNITDVIVLTPSSVMHQPNTTDGVVPSGNETSMSPMFSLTPQVTMTTATFVIAPTTQIVTSSHASSMIPLTATPTVLGTSTRFFITASATKSQGSALLSSIIPTVINVSVIFTPATTLIPTSIGPTLEPSTGPTVPPNNRPVRLNDIGRLEAKVGKAFRYAVPHDTFHDHEDGDTRNLSLSCTLLLKGPIPSDYWVQFDSERQELYGLPLAVDYERYSGKEEYERYILTARDSRGLTARDVFQIVMIFVTDTVTQQLSIRTSNNYAIFTSNVTQRLDLVERIKTYYSDNDTSAIRFVSVTQGSLVVTWTNDTLPSDRCDEEAVQRISSKVISAEGVNSAFKNALEPEFPIQSTREDRFGVCNVTQTYPTIPSRGQQSASETDMWLKHVLPGVLVALLILLLALILVICLRRRRPKPSNPEKITYKKRKPIVLGEEIELKALPARPLILPDDDISCPPSYLSETSLDKAPHYETDDEDEEDFGKRSPSIRYERPPPFYHTFDSPRNTPPPSYRLPPSYKF